MSILILSILDIVLHLSRTLIPIYIIDITFKSRLLLYYICTLNYLLLLVVSITIHPLSIGRRVIFKNIDI